MTVTKIVIVQATRPVKRYNIHLNGCLEPNDDKPKLLKHCRDVCYKQSVILLRIRNITLVDSLNRNIFSCIII